MNICILGDSLTSLSLAKNLVNKKPNGIDPSKYELEIININIIIKF